MFAHKSVKLKYVFTQPLHQKQDEIQGQILVQYSWFEVSLDGTKLQLVVRLHFWSSGQCAVPLYCHDSLVDSNSER